MTKTEWRKIKSRLIQLQKDAKSDGGEMDTRSFLNFATFMTNPRLRMPAISLTPDGDIYASWKTKSIHFLSDGNVKIIPKKGV